MTLTTTRPAATTRIELDDLPIDVQQRFLAAVAELTGEQADLTASADRELTEDELATADGGWVLYAIGAAAAVAAGWAVAAYAGASAAASTVVSTVARVSVEAGRWVIYL